MKLENPILLSWCNFTPLHRTPWAGSQIAKLKSELQGVCSNDLIGESWEFSCDPDFPSQLAHVNTPLHELIKNNLHALLGPYANSPHDCQILVKLIGTKMPLSLLQSGESPPATNAVV